CTSMVLSRSPRFRRLLIRLPLRSALLPYTTLFRSNFRGVIGKIDSRWRGTFHAHLLFLLSFAFYPIHFVQIALSYELLLILLERSEEHTSELQSRENLVCRLLLEKKQQ